MSHLANVALPDFGLESAPPRIPVAVYQARLTAAVAGLGRLGVDVLAVYADREHAANLAYLTGLDPRFEEALLLLDRRGRSLLLVGNECLGYLPDAQLHLAVELFQDFSLMGQPRGSSRPLRDILASFGIVPGTRVGCVGWKCYDTRLTADTRHASDLPSYLVDLLRELVGEARLVCNATGLFTDPADGLRIVGIEPEQIAAFEYASIQTSTSTLAVMRELREGVREDELERRLVAKGLPLSCHRMISFGEKARRGLASPGPNRAALGDVFTIGYGVAGALTSRAGFIARGPEDVPAACRDFYPGFVANYFDVVATWYESLRLGATGGEIFSAVESVRDDSLYSLAVNPGHTLHLDEWVNSPFAAGSRVPLVSGMALQMDIIPVSKGPFCYANAEDGVVLANEALRAAIARQFPACHERMKARRSFMTEVLGIRLDESVLPLSNIPGWLPPYALSLDQAFLRQ
jgi:hypothetical protein